MSLISDIQCYLDGNAAVSNLPNYPKNDNFIQISLHGIDIDIEKGRDTFFYNCFETKSKKNLWYVIFKDELYIEKGFVCYKKAIDEAIKKREEAVLFELDSINVFKKKA